MSRYLPLIRRHGRDILASPGLRSQRGHLQHGRVSVLQHEVAVALMCLKLARGLRLRVDERALVRGALLHDYFLYDWHEKDPSHRWHGFTHPARALRNADRDFVLGDIERDMIACHMFPLVPRLPHRRESALLCLADKLCALRETLRRPKGRVRDPRRAGTASTRR
ncbi:MAG: phosphohydrolase [Clostridia bacterium]|nr:phosphohydrolase [Clostridia bacterium]